MPKRERKRTDVIRDFAVERKNDNTVISRAHKGVEHQTEQPKARSVDTACGLFLWALLNSALY